MNPAVSHNAVVLVSGGLDSAVCLAHARAQGWPCHALTIDYGQRHKHELAAASRVAQSLGAIEHVTLTLDLRAFGGSSLTADIPVPRADAAPTVPAIPSTYVPARNLIFLSLAIAFAESRGAGRVVIGANAVDYSGYPDCRPAFIESFRATANLATKAGSDVALGGLGRGFTIDAPLVSLSKAQIIKAGADLGVDFSLTHSCYDPTPQGLACAVCDSCVLRARGFAQASVPDPTRYATAAPRPA